ncbi:MAG: transglycosylase domain-containing protein [Firmicutes bacterium]|nr:transglycosylase domain-containing protein [Bacillota bacterium]
MKKWIKRIIFFLIALVVLTGFYFTGSGYLMYRDALQETSLSDKVAEIRSKDSYTTLEELPDIYLRAVVSVEDHRFHKHNGIDIIAIGRALWTDIKAMSFVEGGSTITQQLARNMYFTRDKKIKRKIAEIFMAFHIERNYEKDEILELYVNTIYFGNGYYGVREASEGYFGKSPAKLTDYESTLLAGIPNAPSVYALTNDAELARERQQQVINKMISCGNLTEAEAEKILQK